MNKNKNIHHYSDEEDEDLEQIIKSRYEQQENESQRPPQSIDRHSEIPSISPERARNVRNPEPTYHQRTHIPQVIDEDTEVFKTRLENLINNFRTNSLTEFMGMKKSMLDEQSRTINEEVGKYKRLNETLSEELDKMRERYAGVLKDNEKGEKVTTGLSVLCRKTKLQKESHRIMAQHYFFWKAYILNRSRKAKLTLVARNFARKATEKRFFEFWRNDHNSIKEEKIRSKVEKQFQEELDMVTMKFNKEIDSLTRRLNDTTRNLDEANKDRLNMQENLKKAFMRGVCALNFEAMSILQPKEGESAAQTTNGFASNFVTTTQNFTNKVNDVGSNLMGRPSPETVKGSTGAYTVNPVRNDGPFVQVAQATMSPYGTGTFQDEPQNQSQNVVFFNEPKAESKNHKWKAAPIVGSTDEPVIKKVETSKGPQPRDDYPQQSNQNYAPRSYTSNVIVHDVDPEEKRRLIDNILAKDSDTFKENSKPSLPTFLPKGGDDHEDEGKVIRVAGGSKSILKKGIDSSKASPQKPSSAALQPNTKYKTSTQQRPASSKLKQ